MYFYYSCSKSKYITHIIFKLGPFGTLIYKLYRSVIIRDMIIRLLSKKKTDDLNLEEHHTSFKQMGKG